MGQGGLSGAWRIDSEDKIKIRVWGLKNVP